MLRRTSCKSAAIKTLIHYSLFIHCVPSEFLGYPLLESGVDDKKKGKHVARTRRSLFEIGGVFRIPDYLHLVAHCSVPFLNYEKALLPALAH